MTQDQTVLCARCGFANVAGDQFCGSCGSFLEWEGAPATASTVPGAATTPGPAPIAGAGPPAGASTLPTGGPAAGPAGASAQVPVPAPEGLLRCPACGIANAATRTFCQTCGAKLTPAARVASRSHDEIAAAVAAVPGPKPVQPGPPVPGLPPGGAPRAAAPKSGGGLPGWVLVVIVLGVLAGVGAVVGSNLLKGSGPASEVTAAPSLGSSAAASAAAKSGGPSSSAATSASASPSAPAIAAKPLKLIQAQASSIALANAGKYGPQLAIDGSLKTSWQEGSATEKGQWIEVSFDPSTVTAVVVSNGFQASTALYKGNLRLKDVEISVDGGAPIAVRLKDTTGAQKIDLTPVVGATHLRITIVTTYPSVKTSVAGTPFDDAAVSEISVLGVKAP